MSVQDSSMYDRHVLRSAAGNPRDADDGERADDSAGVPRSWRRPTSPDEAMLRSGVRMRTLYQHTARFGQGRAAC